MIASGEHIAAAFQAESMTLDILCYQPITNKLEVFVTDEI